MRPVWKLLFVFACLCHVAASAQAITLYRSGNIELYTLEVGAQAKNEHPVNFVDPDALAQLLASLQIASAEEGDTPIYLLSENDALRAGKELAKALARVDENRDVHLVTWRKVDAFMSTRRLATAARIFVQDGRLNLIFGQLDEFMDEFREPYQKRPRPGRREREELSGGRILSADWFAFKSGRSDWVLYPLDTSEGPRSRRRLASPEAARTEISAPADNTMKPASTVQEDPGASARSSRWQDLEDGLETLQRLHEKGLISDGEYEAKRRVLLDRVGM